MQSNEGYFDRWIGENKAGQGEGMVEARRKQYGEMGTEKSVPQKYLQVPQCATEPGKDGHAQLALTSG